MKSKPIKSNILFLSFFMILGFFVLFFSISDFTVVYSSTMATNLSMSLQDSQQKIKSSINNQELQALADNVKDNNVNNNISNNVINTANNQQQITLPSNNNTIKKVTVGDIDIAYKIFGKGDPILLIPGFSMTMEMWGL